MKNYIYAFILCCVCFVAAEVKAQNYDESKVPPYNLPEVLKTINGDLVTNKVMWEEIRRPEIASLFENEVYGQVPKTYDRIVFSVTRENATSMNGKAHLKEIQIKVYNNDKSVDINLVLFTPNKVTKPAPAFLLINNRSSRNTAPTRDTISGFWPAEMIIDEGYAVAAFQVNDAAPDDKDRYKNGVLQLYPKQLNADNGMKAIGAWAWAASRVMDYFEQDEAIDAKKIAVVGHSRGGKTSLLAAAEDTRFAICIANNSGNTGAALSRRIFGETVARINTSFPHWFNNNYKKYNDKEHLLPVDQHMLIALIAPRPVYITSASEDLWADPKGMFLALKNVEPVYALYGIKSGLPESFPALNAIYRSRLAYHDREGKHDLTEYDWAYFVKFANYHFF